MAVRPVIDATAASRAYAKAFRRLGELPSFDHRTVLRAESGIFLKTWAGETKVATQGLTDRRSRLAAIRHLELTGQHGVSVNAGVRGDYGTVFLRTRNGHWRRTHDPAFRRVGGMTGTGLRTKPGDHYTEHDWLLLQDVIAKTKAAVPRFLESGRKSIGLSRQSVVQIADALNIDLGAVAGGRLSPQALAKARAALASSGRSYRNGVGRLTGDAVRAYAEMVNLLPYNTKIGMDRTADSILAKRAKFIETAYAKGAFESMSGVARSFPNLMTFRASLQ